MSSLTCDQCAKDTAPLGLHEALKAQSEEAPPGAFVRTTLHEEERRRWQALVRARAVLAGIDDGLIEATAEEQAAQCDLVRRREHDWDVIGLLCAVAAFEESTGASSGASFERFVRLLEDTAAREELLYAARHFSAGPCDEAGHEEGRAPAAPETAA